MGASVNVTEVVASDLQLFNRQKLLFEGIAMNSVRLVQGKVC